MANTVVKLHKQTQALIGPDDPPPFEVVNTEGGAPVLFICDHASNLIPPSLDNLGLEDSVLYQHVAWDIGAADVARRLSARFDAPLVLSGYSRLIIDCNRELDDPTSIPKISDTVVVPGNRDLGGDLAAARAEAFFHPYHAAVADALGRFKARGVVPAVISVHSFTPIFKGFQRPWHIGVLWNRDPRLAAPFMAALGRDPSITVGDNEPYSARDNFGYSVDAHGERTGLPHMLVEIRQDLIDTHHGAEAWAGKVGAAIQGVLDPDPGIRTVQNFDAPADGGGRSA